MSNRTKPFVIPFFIPHAGCPHRCAFCNQTSITGVVKPPAPTDIRPVIDRFLAYNHRQRAPVQLAFFGGNFLGLPADIITALLTETEACVGDGLIDNIRFSTRPDTITPQQLDIISDFSVKTIELGIQSMDDKVLSLSRRGHTAAQSEAALLLLKARGYETGAQIMTGLPGDSGEQSIKTAGVITTFQPDFVRIYPAVVISGSELAKWYENGRYKPAGLEETVGLVSRLYRIFENHQIPVIRMGLQPTEDLNDSAVVLAGPYHPAFGHLVLSAIFLEKTIDLINSRPAPPGELTLAVNPRDISKIRGLYNTNIKYLKETFGFRSVRVIKDNGLASGQIACPSPRP